MRIETLKKNKKEKKSTKKTNSDDDEALEESKNEDLCLNVIFYENEVKEKEFKKKFFEQIALDIGKDG